MTLKPKIDPFVTEIIAKLQEAGYEAYIVGGAVRDFLLDRQPKDYDLSTSATPEQVKKVFRDRKCIIIGRRFRLVHLYRDTRGTEIFEISTFRKCPDYTRQNAPQGKCKDAPSHMIFRDNEFGTAHDDAFRRDFTVNAIFYDPVNDKLIDFTGKGLEDIKNKKVRIIGNGVLRFEEDPVRILRALKLVGQYGFTIEDETERALCENMDFIVHAAPARLDLELEKILKNPYGDAILKTFHDFGFLKYFLPCFAENFKTPEVKYAFELLAKRNERMRDGKYRSSLSMAYALMTLPFAEKFLGHGVRGDLWEVSDTLEDELFALIRRVFKPHTIMHRSSNAATRNLLLQHRLKSLTDIDKCQFHTVYMSARELALIQNEVEWHIEDMETMLPVDSHYDPSGRSRNRRKKRRRNNRAQGNSNGNNADNGGDTQKAASDD